MTLLEISYPETNDCFALEKQINILRNDINTLEVKFKGAEPQKKLLKERKELLYVLGCEEKIEAKRQADTKAIFDKNAALAKNRITTDSVSTRNILVGISAVILVVGTVIIIKNK